MNHLHEQPAYRVDGQPVGAARFYATACDPARSVVVEACAGAGKTWMLVSRILRALLDGAQPQQILAITFTRKAAGEMRERLADWLREFAHADDAARREALRQRGLDAAGAAALSDRLAGLHEQLLLGGRTVEIRTFHGWFSQLLRAAPLELLSQLGLAPGVELVEDAADLAPDLFRRFHAAVRADAALKDDFFTLVRERGRSQLRKWLEAAWARRVEFEAADAAGTLDDSVEPAAARWPEFAGLSHPAERLQAPVVRELMLCVAAALGSQPGAIARKQGAALEQALASGDPLQALQAARAALLTKDGELRKKLDAPGLAEAVAWLEDIRRAVEQQHAHVEHGRMVRLARVLLAQYATLKRQRGLADMADLEHCALHLLRDSALSGWVQERLDQRVRHVLIDEFQDTSPLQWRALHGWLSAYAGAGGGASGQRPPSVFIVGDPKQSIYRFRGAEPRVFLAARAFVAEALGGAVLECDHTRRNATEVLQVINTVFMRLQAAGHFEGFRPHTTGAPPGAPGAALLPRVERPGREVAAPLAISEWRDSLTMPRHEPEEGMRQREAEQVALAVKGLLAQGVAAGDIFVLARKRAVLRQAALALQAHGIAHVAPEDNALMASAEVRDLVAVLDVLASPAHDLSLAHALKSPLFGATDEHLLWLAQRAEGGRWLPALRRAVHEAPPALQRAATLLARWAAQMQRLPPHDLLDRIVHEGELMPRLLASVPAARRQAARQSVQALLNLALQLDGARYASVYGFVRALKRRALTVSAGAVPDAVQLLTVHGAKGLEARAVLLMDCDAPGTRADTVTLLVDWPVDREAPVRCAFVASEARCAPTLQALLAREQAAREREELNGLYVALTRAREQLLLSSVAPHQRANEVSWWALLSPWLPPWPWPPTAAPVHLQPGAVVYRGLPAWQPDAPSRAPAVAAPEARSEEARLGEALHRVLEWATATPGAPLAPLAAAAASAYGLVEPAQAQLLRHARAVLDSPAARQFFDPAGLAWAGNEVSLADGDAVVRLDRLVALADGDIRTWWVLDYKLQSAPHTVPAYLEQLRHYRTLVQALQPADRVRAAFITAAGEVIEP
ncbi:UvrD-helicase domain-containing protein [Ideonella sp. BN130291]|uniref:UvrD-helicase domain-containing protein n=1 Tax=Ideonella sp. BN130291 TaxID=3112940 RepID=UPI002E264651|nr:UvrD-helicase domain-containing protein [Ideonella sp. BN130291]